MRMSMISWLICSLALAALLVVVGSKRLLPPPTGAQGEALIGGDFTLMDGDGLPIRVSDFRGKYMLVYFGFTHCPDICPTTLLVMKNALNAMGDDKSKITPIFISLDPERDTPAVVKQYISNFGDTLIGLTGNAEQVKDAADAYRVYYSKVPQPDSASGYLIDHSGFIYLMDKRGRYVAHFAHTISETDLTSKLNQLVK
ncbi:MAG: SCO family protein [Alphaproteobacteria bacterium]|nr:SCO family protein [Alphaproteobacteria bacterium]